MGKSTLSNIHLTSHKHKFRIDRNQWLFIYKNIQSIQGIKLQNIVDWMYRCTFRKTEPE